MDRWRATLQEQPQVLMVAAAVGLLVYLHLASVQFNVNHDIGRTDQSAYIHFAKVAYKTDFTYTGQRNRMPLFPWIQALLYRPDMEDEEFFRQGKLVNVAISLVSIALLGVAFSRASPAPMPSLPCWLSVVCYTL